MRRTKNPGKTTVSPGGLIKKTFWFRPDEAYRLRKAAFEEETTQAELVRAAVRSYFGMDVDDRDEERPDPIGENLAEDVAEDMRSVPELREELASLLREFTSSPEKTAELMTLLEGEADDGKVTS